jgi:prepilin-type N-terminal cleavage/methylation domain-containing protein
MSYQKGFTLFEIIIVLAIITFVISFGLVMDLNSIKRDSLRSEESVIVSTLEKARGRSMNNIYASTHGFCYMPPNYIIFKGRQTCTPISSTDEIIPANTNIASNAGSIFPSQIIFSQLAGTTTASTIHITDGVKSVDIIINYEGTILW